MPTDSEREIKRLNLLTELGIISDLVVTSRDIAKADADFAAAIVGNIMTEADIPIYTLNQYEAAKAASDALQDELREANETNAALGLPPDRALESMFSRALRQTRFFKRRLEEQNAK